MSRIFIGISSWADAALVKSGRFYPPEAKTPAERLSYYASVFSVAEIDSTFHAFATRNNLDLWLANTPAGFKFNVKAFSLFTQHPTPFVALPRSVRASLPESLAEKGRLYSHHLPEEALDQLWQGFAAMLEQVQAVGKLGAVLFQFPPWYHFRQENLDYIARCKERLVGFQLAIEFRTGDWFQEGNRARTLDFLREHGLALVAVDEPQGQKSSVPPVAEVTAPLGIIRFHGRNTENWEKKETPENERFRYLYSQPELEEWLPRIRSMAENCDELHLIFKNKYEDYPVRNALQMKGLLKAFSNQQPAISK